MPSSPPKSFSVLSSRAKRGICFCLASLFSAIVLSGAPTAPSRPRIFRIQGVRIFTTDVPQARAFYGKVLDNAHDCEWCEEMPGRTFSLNYGQVIGLSPVPSPAPSNLIEEITLATENIEELRRYFIAQKIQVSERKRMDNAVGPFLSVLDPEGHKITFVQSTSTPLRKPGYPLAPPNNLYLIHAGFIVHDRAAEDRFYKDILGFHVYWHGGRKDDETSWVDMQVPDGTDWIEYMLNVPANADHHTLGVMNHIALGVPDIHAAEAQLRKNGWSGNEKPKIGRDGKWQLNLYDPDDTRVEFMEFTPVQKPCCSDYTGPHPKP